MLDAVVVFLTHLELLSTYWTFVEAEWTLIKVIFEGLQSHNASLSTRALLALEFNCFAVILEMLAQQFILELHLTLRERASDFHRIQHHLQVEIYLVNWSEWLATLWTVAVTL